jgi:UDP-N-acetylglucosamine--N-acetylmuramyl-(pentapeptide) pyrophosphoryl-undecaprenol N-acetylglucosamine transferase
MQNQTKKINRVLIMAGGTGGHIFPGLALARYLQEQGVEVHWLGTSKGLEAQIVPAANIPLHLINIGGLRGKNTKALITAPYKIFTATMQARRIISALKPDAVVGMGGFASGPGGFASWLLGCPLIVHEQNAKAGLTNKLLARLAKRVLEGFPGAFAPSSKVITVGNPVRIEIERIPAPASALASSKCKILVLGGSLGAQALNETVPQSLSLIPQNERPEVWHQAGDKHFANAKNNYESKEIAAKVVPFIQDMAAAYQWADIVICRAGALTVAELCVAGRGAIFVPFPHAVDDHQTANAHYMVDNHAALCLQQADLTPQLLADHLKIYLHFPEKRLAMAKQAYALRKTHVAERIFDILSSVVGK